MSALIDQARAEIDAAKLSAEKWRTGRRLLDACDDSGSCVINYAELLSVTECTSVQGALRHLTLLAGADVIHYSTNENVYVSFRAFSRSNGAPTRSCEVHNGAPTRSNGAPTRSCEVHNGAPTRSNGAPTRSCEVHNGAPTRSNGAPPEGAVTHADAPLIDQSDHDLIINTTIDRSVINQWLIDYDEATIAKAIRRSAQYKVTNLAAYVGKVLSTQPFRREPVADSEPAADSAGIDEDSPLWAAHQVWVKALSELQLQLASSTYYSWLHDSWVVGCEEGEGGAILALTVGVSNTYQRDWLQHRLRIVVERTVKNGVGHAVSVDFEVRPRG
jgi:hypothetical protein